MLDRRSLAFLLALTGAACSSSTSQPAAPSGPTITCPAPIGVIPQESCADIADDFGALDVTGALALAGSGKDAAPRVEAIRAVAALAASIKEQRVKLCEQYAKCKVPTEEHAAQDKLLTGGMRSLIDLWNKRRFSNAGDVIRFREAVRVIDVRVNGSADGGAVVTQKPPRTWKAEEALGRVEDPGVAFRVASPALTVSATAEGKRDALRTKPEVLSLAGSHRYRIKIKGQYAPASAPIVQPGDELVARLKFRATQAADVQLALRSLEDPEGNEAAETWKIGAGDKGAHEIKLTADPQQSGFFLGLGVRGGSVDVDDVELLRGGKVIAAAHGEGGDEPLVKTECAPSKDKPIAGKGSLRCAPGNGDRVTIGKPESYLMITLRDSAGERATLRTLSLQGGRSIDAALREDGGEIVFTLVGAGSATIEQLEVTDLGAG